MLSICQPEDDNKQSRFSNEEYWVYTHIKKRVKQQANTQPITIIIASSVSLNHHSGFVPCDRSLNPHNALHRRALNLTT